MVKSKIMLKLDIKNFYNEKYYFVEPLQVERKELTFRSKIRFSQKTDDMRNVF